MIALGHKKIETRSWTTKYRGPLYIHAAKKIIDWPSITIQAVFSNIALEPSNLPLGAIIAKVYLVDCKEILDYNQPKYPERAYGDYTPHRFMWITDNLETFDPIPYQGRQGLFNVNMEEL